MKNIQFKAYFYNGFDKPKLLATSLHDLLEKVEINDNYLDDITDYFREDIKEWDRQNLNELNEITSPYNIYINPTLDSLIEVSKTWFNTNIPIHHFSEFKEEA